MGFRFADFFVSFLCGSTGTGRHSVRPSATEAYLTFNEDCLAVRTSKGPDVGPSSGERTSFSWSSRLELRLVFQRCSAIIRRKIRCLLDVDTQDATKPF